MGEFGFFLTIMFPEVRVSEHLIRRPSSDLDTRTNIVERNVKFFLNENSLKFEVTLSP
jgi:hypothetical protein